MFRGDIKTIEFMVHTIAYLFPDFQFSWIVPEFKEFLTEELDFINEGKNAEKIQSFFPNMKQIQIPKIYWVRSISLPAKYFGYVLNFLYIGIQYQTGTDDGILRWRENQRRPSDREDEIGQSRSR